MFADGERGRHRDGARMNAIVNDIFIVEREGKRRVGVDCHWNREFPAAADDRGLWNAAAGRLGQVDVALTDSGAASADRRTQNVQDGKLGPVDGLLRQIVKAAGYRIGRKFTGGGHCHLPLSLRVNA